MNFDDFEALVSEKARENPVWFGLPSDKLASLPDVEAAERDLNVKFPVEYVEFLLRYGGGYFALGVVFSLDADSEFYVLKKNSRKLVSETGFLTFSDNGMGDLYAFRVTSGECLSDVFFYDHEINSWVESGLGNLFEFLARYALSS